MLYIFRLLLLLINIDQETVLNWFGIEDTTNQEFQQAFENGYDFTISNFETSTDISLDTFRLIIEGLWEKIQNGLTLADIENILFFILFIRFIILAFRYNLKTSFYITCIGLFAGYLWYKHLIDLILLYRNVLLRTPFLSELGMDSIQMRFTNRQMTGGGLSNSDEIFYSAIVTKGILQNDSDPEITYYIDPISMIVSNLNEPYKAKIWPIYYQVYNRILPKIFSICTKFWTQISGIAAYAFITRIGKKYCPYLVRWHWTFLIILGLVEQTLIHFVYRMIYFQTFILIPKLSISDTSSGLGFQMNTLNFLITVSLLSHIGFVIFGLFHAIWGQYFYFPFFVENTELHIGPRPRNSIYSGGQTAWQYPDEKNGNRLFATLWFGWFGHGSNISKKSYYSEDKITRKKIKRFIKKFLRRLKKRIKKIRRK